MKHMAIPNMSMYMGLLQTLDMIKSDLSLLMNPTETTTL